MATYNVFANADRGWSFRSLVEHLGMDHKAVRRQLHRKGLRLDARPGHTLTERDVETVTAVVMARRQERLYGASRRIR